VEINRILGSNASAAVKQKARLLMTWLANPGFDSLKDNYAFADVVADVDLYLDCWVIWKGMATNLSETPSSLEFDFLVGYDTRNRLEGIIPASFTGGTTLDTDTPLEALGRIVLEDGRLSLRVVAVHQTGKPAGR